METNFYLVVIEDRHNDDDYELWTNKTDAIKSAEKHVAANVERYGEDHETPYDVDGWVFFHTIEDCCSVHIERILLS